MKCAVVYTTGGYRDSLNNGKGGYPEYAHKLQTDAETQPLWEDDVTVRVTTEPIELKPGEEATHKYLLYNGPVKVMLLSQPDAAAEAVPPAVVSHYMDDLNLNTLTDYQSNGLIGNITGSLYITPLLIKITNVMHWVLWFLHAYLFIPYIVCIICLTLMVRGMMFPVSRKQAMTSLRMQQLAPETEEAPGEVQGRQAGHGGGPDGAVPQARRQPVRHLLAACSCKCRSSWVCITPCRRASISGWPASRRGGCRTWPRPDMLV